MNFVQYIYLILGFILAFRSNEAVKLVFYILGIVVCIMFLARAVCVILPLVFKIEIHNFPIIMDKEVRCILANKSQQ